MVELRKLLLLDQDELPDYTTIYKSFDRLKGGGVELFTRKW
jgi:hypothetical protein